MVQLNIKLFGSLLIILIVLMSLVFFSELVKWGLGGVDYRQDVERITEPGDYGTGDWGREIELFSGNLEYGLPIVYSIYDMHYI